MITAVIITLIAALIPAKILYRLLGPQFGGPFHSTHKRQYARSPQWDGKKFNNTSTTTMDVGARNLPAMIREFNAGKKQRTPGTPLPIAPFETSSFNHLDKPSFIWYGHSVLLMRLWGKNLLIDPMFGPDASPIAPFRTKRFSSDTLAIIDQLPDLDAVLFTHDHYDHIDLASIHRLKNKVSSSCSWFVALGVGRHLEKWGIEKQQIKEFDWWEQTNFNGIEITFTPSRHFGGRGPFDRAKSLWGGWTFKTADHAIYWSGDGGFDNHFAQIGERLGPFDWAFLECGQYNSRWHQIHMYPEEAVQAGHDVRARIITPIHWGGFSLAFHPWKEPVERFVAEAEKTDMPFYIPRLGELVEVDGTPQNSFWWRDVN
jgi:L-ascorbate metabolism protein UlaG (beta-lactamase superfamily)